MGPILLREIRVWTEFGYPHTSPVLARAPTPKTQCAHGKAEKKKKDALRTDCARVKEEK